MTEQLQTKHSDYMEWAKLHSTARFNLATSGILSVPAAEFPAVPEQLEITSAGGYGYTALQQRIASHTGAAVECIVAAAGTSMANHLAMATLLSPYDEVLIEQPAYGPLLDVANYLGVKVKRFPRRVQNDFAVDLEEVRRAITPATRLIVITNLHNPSGALADAETLRALGQLALRARAHVLVDEVYLEMMPDRARRGSFAIGHALVGADENPFIVTSSLTKAYGLSGLRCGWIVAAPPLAHRIWRLNDLFSAKAAHAAEQLSVIAFDHLERFRARARALLEANWPLLDAFLDERSDLECMRPPAGSIVFPRLRRGDADEFITLLREKYDTSVVPGRFFEMPQHFRIGISGEAAEVRAGLTRLSAALDEFAS